MHEKTTPIPINDRSLLYGDGLFETICLEHGILIHWQLHWSRLLKGCKALGITAPSKNHVLQSIVQKASQVKSPKQMIRIYISRSEEAQGYKPICVQPYFNVQAVEQNRPWHPKLEGQFCQTPVSFQPMLHGLKHANRLDQVLASLELQDKSEVGIMQNASGHVACANFGNIFFVKNKTLFTPSLDQGGIEGTVREWLLQQHACQVVQVSCQTLIEADEIAVTNSLIGVASIGKLAENIYKSDTIVGLQHSFDQCKFDSTHSLVVTLN